MTKLIATYQGWSGWTIKTDDGAQLIFDPAPNSRLTGDNTLILITHGHPEHCLGALRHIKNANRNPVTVVASRSVCQYLMRASVNAEDIFHIVNPNDVIKIRNWNIMVFEWAHMGLLPPGVLNKLQYLRTLVAHPKNLLRIIVEGVHGPKHSPMLGFHVESFQDSIPPIVYIGEGLHRRTRAEVLSRALPINELKPSPLLIAGIEPEDVLDIPYVLANQRFEILFMFEPHQVWRNEFGLPCANLEELKTRLSSVGILSQVAKIDVPINFCVNVI